MIDRLKMIPQGLAPNRDSVFDHLRRFAQRQRIAFDGV